MSRSESANQKSEGWAWLLNAAKHHYFRDSQSLCRRWAYLGDEYIEDDNLAEHDKCRLCALKRKREKEKSADPT